MFQRIKSIFGGSQDLTVQDIGYRFLKTSSLRSSPRKGASGILSSFSSSPAIGGICSRIAMDVSSNGFRLNNVSGQEDEQIWGHPLIDCLSRTVMGLPPGSQLYLVQLWLDLVGEGGLVKKRDDSGAVVSLWPLTPTWVKDKPKTEDGSYVVSVSGSEFEIPSSEVVWFHRPDPSDPFGRGVGVGSSVSDEIEIAELSSKTIKQWFVNGGKPDVLIVGEGMDKKQTDTLEQKWDERHGGFWKKFRPAFMGGKGVTVHQLAVSFKEMELAKLRQDERRVIQQTFGVPPEIMGDVQNSNRATIEASDLIYSKRVILPRLRAIYSVLNVSLVPEFGEGLEIVFDNPVEDDRRFRLEAMRAAPWSYRIDEWREISGMDALPDGKGQIFMLPPNLLPAKWPGDELDFLKNELADKSVKSIGKSGVISLFPAAQRALKEIKLAPVMVPTLAEVVLHFGEATEEEFGKAFDNKKDFDFTDPKIAEFLRSIAGERIAKIEETTLRHLRRLFEQSELEGQTVGELAGQIQKVLGREARSRSYTIARTETVRAANFGNFESGRQLDVERKEWLATMDGNERDEHAYLDGLEPIPYDKPFVGPSGEQAMYPGDFGDAEMDINCRCTVLPVPGEKSIYNTIEKRQQKFASHDRERARFEVRLRRAVRTQMLRQVKSILEAIQ